LPCVWHSYCPLNFFTHHIILWVYFVKMSVLMPKIEMILGNTEEEMEFMPIVPLGEDEMDEQEKGELPLEIPIIALRNTVLFPNVVLPITVSREKSVKAITKAQKEGKWIG